MVRRSTRAVLWLLVGLFVGLAFGLTLAPDPTGYTPLVLAAVIAVVVGGVLYWSSFLRDEVETG